MSAKKKAIRAVVKKPTTPREIISTCQIQTTAGTPVTWTAFRRVGAPEGAMPDFYVCSLPDNTDDASPSEYPLKAIAAQSKLFTITLRALDRDVVYYVTTSGGDPERVPVSRGEPFIVPAQITDGANVSVTLTFDGDCCTIEAVPNRSGTVEGEQGPTPPPTDEGGGPPPPLPEI